MKLRELREAAGLMKVDIARAMGVDVAAVSRWESGDAFPMAARLPALADVLGCTIDDLFGREVPGHTSA